MDLPLPGTVSHVLTTPTSPWPEELGFWGQSLDDDAESISWLWDGFLAPGNVTLLTSQWKSGKTTLIAVLLAKLKQGGSLLDLRVQPARAVIVSEEPRALWRLRHRKLDLGHVYFICQPFRGKPSLDQWLALLDRIADLQRRHGINLLAIDTLTTFLPGRNEANAGVLMEALLPLRQLTQRDLSILLAHHPAKGEPLPGQAARGSGALASFTDINLEMSWYSRGDTSDRRRRLLAHSRYEQTLRQLVFELNPEASDYLVHGDFSHDEFMQNWDCLRMVLEDATGKRNRQEIIADWPPDFPCPSQATLARWLGRAVAAGLICQQGSGRAHEPFRYWLPDKEQQWKKDPLFILNQRIEEDRELLRRKLG